MYFGLNGLPYKDFGSINVVLWYTRSRKTLPYHGFEAHFLGPMYVVQRHLDHKGDQSCVALEPTQLKLGNLCAAIEHSVLVPPG